MRSPGSQMEEIGLMFAGCVIAVAMVFIFHKIDKQIFTVGNKSS